MTNGDLWKRRDDLGYGYRQVSFALAGKHGSIWQAWQQKQDVERSHLTPKHTAERANGSKVRLLYTIETLMHECDPQRVGLQKSDEADHKHPQGSLE